MYLFINLSINKESFPEIDPVQGLAIKIEKEMLTEAVNKTKKGKTRGPTGVVVECLKLVGALY